eukprot:TRINITY_DN3271_c0_g1_i3.p1 TRINITY_DN3271_c0_g1~~TRINITY_DN3271_c0_g1_i3.p1  ORF type:complete len:3105 (+),score=665.52 TRINITY_DN3271_c0_g1_i3:26-9340(+)
MSHFDLNNFKTHICGLCQNLPVQPKTLPCGHTFCRDCLSRYLAMNSTACPTCGREYGSSIQSVDSLSCDPEVAKAIAQYSNINVISLDEIQPQQEIGRGSFGIVYRALYNNEIYAYKQISDITRQTHNTFFDEVFVQYHLNHKNVVKCYGLVEQNIQNDRKFIGIMFECAAMDLSHFLLSSFQLLSTAQKLQLILDIAKGIEYVHGFDIAHSDISDSNVVVFPEFDQAGNFIEVHGKLTDFGLAHARTSEISGRGSTLKALTPYCAPERYFLNHYDRKHCDVFSFGVLANQIMTGQIPFANMNIIQIQEAFRSSIRPLQAPDAPDGLNWVISMCWSLMPYERPTMSSVVTRLEHIVKAFRETHVLPSFEFDFGDWHGDYAELAQLGGGMGATSSNMFDHITGDARYRTIVSSSICKECSSLMQNSVSLICKHSFCEKCIAKLSVCSYCGGPKIVTPQTPKLVKDALEFVGRFESISMDAITDLVPLNRGGSLFELFECTYAGEKYVFKQCRPEVRFPLMTEATLLLQLKHRNLATPVGLIFDDNSSGLLYPRYQHNLIEFLAQDWVKDMDKFYVFRELVITINHMHSLGVTHRWLKPENIFVNMEEGRLRVIVDGMFLSHARECVEVISPFTDPSILFKRKNKTIEVDYKQADIYSLAGILYYMFVNEYPVEIGKLTNTAYLKLLHFGKRPTIPADAHPLLHLLVEKMWAKTDRINLNDALALLEQETGLFMRLMMGLLTDLDDLPQHDQNGRSWIDYFITYGNLGMVKSRKSAKKVQQLIDGCVSGKTNILHLIAKFNRYDFVEFFVSRIQQANISVNLTDENGNLPVALGFIHNNVETVDVMLAYDASPISVDGSKSPLQYAIANDILFDTIIDLSEMYDWEQLLVEIVEGCHYAYDNLWLDRLIERGLVDMNHILEISVRKGCLQVLNQWLKEEESKKIVMKFLQEFEFDYDKLRILSYTQMNQLFEVLIDLRLKLIIQCVIQSKIKGYAKDLIELYISKPKMNFKAVNLSFNVWYRLFRSLDDITRAFSILFTGKIQVKAFLEVYLNSNTLDLDYIFDSLLKQKNFLILSYLITASFELNIQQSFVNKVFEITHDNTSNNLVPFLIYGMSLLSFDTLIKSRVLDVDLIKSLDILNFFKLFNNKIMIDGKEELIVSDDLLYCYLDSVFFYELISTGQYQISQLIEVFNRLILSLNSDSILNFKPVALRYYSNFDAILASKESNTIFNLIANGETDYVIEIFQNIKKFDPFFVDNSGQNIAHICALYNDCKCLNHLPKPIKEEDRSKLLLVKDNGGLQPCNIIKDLKDPSNINDLAFMEQICLFDAHFLTFLLNSSFKYWAIEFYFKHIDIIGRNGRFLTLLVNEPDLISHAFTCDLPNLSQYEWFEVLIQLVVSNNNRITQSGINFMHNLDGDFVTQRKSIFEGKPLFELAKNNQIDCLNQIVDFGLQIDHEMINKFNTYNVLHFALEGCAFDTFDKVAKLQPQIAKQLFDSTLKRAVDDSQYSDLVAKLCLSKAFLIDDIVDEQGNTMLHLAIKNKNIDQAHLLRQLGANPNIANKNGDTCVNLAVDNNYGELMSVMANPVSTTIVVGLFMVLFVLPYYLHFPMPLVVLGLQSLLLTVLGFIYVKLLGYTQTLGNQLLILIKTATFIFSLSLYCWYSIERDNLLDVNTLKWCIGTNHLLALVFTLTEIPSIKGFLTRKQYVSFFSCLILPFIQVSSSFFTGEKRFLFNTDLTSANLILNTLLPKFWLIIPPLTLIGQYGAIYQNISFFMLTSVIKAIRNENYVFLNSESDGQVFLLIFLSIWLIYSLLSVPNPFCSARFPLPTTFLTTIVGIIMFANYDLYGVGSFVIAISLTNFKTHGISNLLDEIIFVIIQTIVAYICFNQNAVFERMLNLLALQSIFISPRDWPTCLLITLSIAIPQHIKVYNSYIIIFLVMMIVLTYINGQFKFLKKNPSRNYLLDPTSFDECYQYKFNLSSLSVLLSSTMACFALLYYIGLDSTKNYLIFGYDFLLLLPIIVFSCHFGYLGLFIGPLIYLLAMYLEVNLFGQILGIILYVTFHWLIINEKNEEDFKSNDGTSNRNENLNKADEIFDLKITIVCVIYSIVVAIVEILDKGLKESNNWVNLGVIAFMILNFVLNRFLVLDMKYLLCCLFFGFLEIVGIIASENNPYLLIIVIIGSIGLYLSGVFHTKYFIHIVIGLGISLIAFITYSYFTFICTLVGLGSGLLLLQEHYESEKYSGFSIISCAQISQVLIVLGVGPSLFGLFVSPSYVLLFIGVFALIFLHYSIQTEWDIMVAIGTIVTIPLGLIIGMAIAISSNDIVVRYWGVINFIFSIAYTLLVPVSESFVSNMYYIALLFMPIWRLQDFNSSIMVIVLWTIFSRIIPNFFIFKSFLSMIQPTVKFLLIAVTYLSLTISSNNFSGSSISSIILVLGIMFFIVTSIQFFADVKKHALTFHYCFIEILFKTAILFAFQTIDVSISCFGLGILSMVNDSTNIFFHTLFLCFFPTETLNQNIMMVILIVLLIIRIYQHPIGCRLEFCLKEKIDEDNDEGGDIGLIFVWLCSGLLIPTMIVTLTHSNPNVVICYAAFHCCIGISLMRFHSMCNDSDMHIISRTIYLIVGSITYFLLMVISSSDIQFKTIATVGYSMGVFGATSFRFSTSPWHGFSFWSICCLNIIFTKQNALYFNFQAIPMLIAVILSVTIDYEDYHSELDQKSVETMSFKEYFNSFYCGYTDLSKLLKFNFNSFISDDGDSTSYQIITTVISFIVPICLFSYRLSKNSSFYGRIIMTCFIGITGLSFGFIPLVLSIVFAIFSYFIPTLYLFILLASLFLIYSVTTQFLLPSVFLGIVTLLFGISADNSFLSLYAILIFIPIIIIFIIRNASSDVFSSSFSSLTIGSVGIVLAIFVSEYIFFLLFVVFLEIPYLYWTIFTVIKGSIIGFVFSYTFYFPVLMVIYQCFVIIPIGIICNFYDHRCAYPLFLMSSLGGGEEIIYSLTSIGYQYQGIIKVIVFAVWEQNELLLYDNTLLAFIFDAILLVICRVTSVIYAEDNDNGAPMIIAIVFSLLYFVFLTIWYYALTWPKVFLIIPILLAGFGARVICDK